MKDYYPVNGFVIQDSMGYRAFQYQETIESFKKRRDPRVKDEKFLKDLKKKIYGVNWKDKYANE
tara:strand:- start:58 stop:249 length:192 start_codon:yes stop_codon:yes gene_type:complete